ncbi:MAG: uncharacterized protein KVP18_005127 [Porospora cf. gigantea A]|uniref:uncharacterized protein n=1 Tax=Porospora cf. gigantea A TaxID=2853593 RepID=UPI00355AA008|nr:MAG: hypothetical protein KVP18_005127 [Porospora cf. gigantea A]
MLWWPTFITVTASLHLFPRNDNIGHRPGEQANAYQTGFAFRGQRSVESGTTKAVRTCSMATAIPYGMLGPRPRMYIKPDDCYSISGIISDEGCRLLCSTLHWSGSEFNCYQAQLDGYFKQDFFPLLCRVDGRPTECVGDDCVVGSPNRGNGCFDFVLANIGDRCKTADCYEDPYFRSKTHTEAAKDIGSGTVAVGGAVGAVTTFGIFTCCGGLDVLGIVDNGGEAMDLLDSSDNRQAGDGMRSFVRTSLLQRAASE